LRRRTMPRNGGLRFANPPYELKTRRLAAAIRNSRANYARSKVSVEKNQIS
jgi:hypothetical protein